MSDAGGYRDASVGGARVRADIVEVHVVRGGDGGGNEGGNVWGDGYVFLQVLRAHEPLAGTWHPVMGHVEAGERAWETALRELEEELGLSRDDPALLGVYALEQVHPFYLAALDCVVLSPRFVAVVGKGWEPVLNEEHSAHRWVDEQDAAGVTMWAGQKRVIEEIRQEILRAGSLSRQRLGLDLRAR